jgi:hypothetical protein
VLLLVVTVIVDDPAPLTEVGLKLAVAPVGSPPTVNPVLPENPFCAVTLAVYVVLPPTTTDCVLGVAASKKSGTELTPSVTVV